MKSLFHQIKTTPTVAGFALLLAFFSARSAEGQTYTVQGHAKRWIFTGKTWDLAFAVTVSNRAWGLEVVQTSPPPKSRYEVMKGRETFDGRTLACFLYDRTGIPINGRGSVQLEENPIVEAAGGMIGIGFIWIAYASGSMFESAQRGELPDLSESQTLADRLPNVRRPAEWAVNQSRPGLPQWLRLYYDYNAIPVSLRPATRDRARLLDISYSASNFTNRAGLAVPLQWQAVMFGVQPPNSTHRLTNETIMAWTDAFLPGVRSDLLDLYCDGVWTVDEARFAEGYGEGVVAYQITNSFPPDPDSPELRSVKAKARAQIAYAKLERRRAAPRLDVHRFFIILASITTAIFIGIFWRIRSQQNERKTES